MLQAPLGGQIRAVSEAFSRVQRVVVCGHHSVGRKVFSTDHGTELVLNTVRRCRYCSSQIGCEIILWITARKQEEWQQVAHRCGAAGFSPRR